MEWTVGAVTTIALASWSGCDEADNWEGGVGQATGVAGAPAGMEGAPCKPLQVAPVELGCFLATSLSEPESPLALREIEVDLGRLCRPGCDNSGDDETTCGPACCCCWRSAYS